MNIILIILSNFIIKFKKILMILVLIIYDNIKIKLVEFV
jgi:hypothetical protein